MKQILHPNTERKPKWENKKINKSGKRSVSTNAGKHYNRESKKWHKELCINEIPDYAKTKYHKDKNTMNTKIQSTSDNNDNHNKPSC